MSKFLTKLTFLICFATIIEIINSNEFDRSGSNQPKFVTLETNMGEITIELFWRQTPKTCRNFAELAKRGYYDNTIFHRVIDGFMIQGGDPTGTGRGGQSIYGEKFEDEFSDELKHDSAGIVSMANSGPDTNGSQFFITLGPTEHLNGVHTIFGKVRDGLNIVQKIGKVKTGKNNKPVNTVKIIRTKLYMN